MTKHTKFHTKHEAFTDLSYESNDLLPDRYVFVLTNQCNLRCDFCFQEKTKLETNLNLEDWLHLIDQLPEYARVTFTGGEPFMYEHFKEVFKKVAQKHSCNIISNGLLLTDDIIELLLSYENFEVLSISLEDKLNKNRNVPLQKWKNTEQQIKKFVQLKQKRNLKTLLDIKTVVLDENANTLFEMYEYAKNELQCDTHAFQFLKGSKLQHSDKMYDLGFIYEKSYAYIYKNFEIIKNELKKIASTRPEKTFIHPKFFQLEEDIELSNIDIVNKTEINVKDFKPCKFPWSSVHINYDGNLYPCLSVSMGNIKNETLEDIIFGPKFKEFKRVLKNDGIVQGCNRCGWLRLKDE